MRAFVTLFLLFLASLASSPLGASPLITKLSGIKSQIEASTANCGKLLLRPAPIPRLIVVTSERGFEDTSRHSTALRLLKYRVESAMDFTSLDYSRDPQGEIDSPVTHALSENSQLVVVPRTHAYSLHSTVMLLFVANSSLPEAAATIEAVVKTFSVDAEDILVLHNDLDLKTEDAKLYFCSSESTISGHRGLNGLRQKIGGFYRLRIGVGRPAERSQIGSYLGEETQIGKTSQLRAPIEQWLKERVGSLRLDPQSRYRDHFLAYLSESTVAGLERKRPWEFIFKDSDPGLSSLIYRLVDAEGIETMGDVLKLRPNTSQWGSIKFSEVELQTLQRWLVLLRAHMSRIESLPRH